MPSPSIYVQNGRHMERVGYTQLELEAHRSDFVDDSGCTACIYINGYTLSIETRHHEFHIGQTISCDAILFVVTGIEQRGSICYMTARSLGSPMIGMVPQRQIGFFKDGARFKHHDETDEQYMARLKDRLARLHRS